MPNTSVDQQQAKGPSLWIFTETGFVSAVCESPGSATVKVRARDRQSLEGLSELGSTEILELSARDYPYRVIVSKVWTAMHAVTDTADAKARSLYYRD